MDLAIENGSLKAVSQHRLLIESDTREQIAFGADCVNGYAGPVLAMSERRLRDNAQKFKSAMPRVRPHFAVKALTAKCGRTLGIADLNF